MTDRALQSLDDLAAAGLADPAEPRLAEVERAFRIRVTPEMVAAAAHPAVARQFVPAVEELSIGAGELSDPIGDVARSPVTGVTHRYRDRVILHVTRTCDVYCRFCFRREVVGGEGMLSDADLAAALDYIERTEAVREVILTGGDPLVLSPRRLQAIVGRLGQIAHLDQLRIHSRVPVVTPQRVDEAMIRALRVPVPVWLVVHVNHEAELGLDSRAALGRLADAGIPLLSQSVLLRGVNDSADALEALFRALLRLRVKPYYLHHCDLARGAGHFRTTIALGRQIMAELRRRLTGIGLPTYVLDIPGGFGKVPVTGDHLVEDGPGRWLVRDPDGRMHPYADPA
ncbi:lysine-2,3-aminomutase-like protein [Cereibacter sphaeroides]|uniref:lysine-2,3-aminomutase-like protein n=1 Tax=Cereibacter sphaeroides TaxID=1063 RepID=UPI001F342888|nr:lysine-2,3-aminomutase-like protein [Cereibacter sphaeroides]MCE6951469.1 lysine-2,3-aminomutase-like protein [Cereibacter sphaeroides]